MRKEPSREQQGGGQGSNSPDAAGCVRAMPCSPYFELPAAGWAGDTLLPRSKGRATLKCPCFSAAGCPCFSRAFQCKINPTHHRAGSSAPTSMWSRSAFLGILVVRVRKPAGVSQ